MTTRNVNKMLITNTSTSGNCFTPNEACADAKCRLEGTEIRTDTVRNSLNKTRSNNLPPDKPGIIFVKVPQMWLEQDSVRRDIYEVVEVFLESTRRIVSVVVYAPS